MVKIYRFLVTLVVTIIFAITVNFVYIFIFEKIVEYLMKYLPWENDVLSCIMAHVIILLLPMCIFAILLFNNLIVKLPCFLLTQVRGARWIAILPSLFFIIKMIEAFIILFLNPINGIALHYDQGLWYYIGAIITFVAISLNYIFCSYAMFIQRWETLKI